jgi:hypothetical protein
MDPLLGTNNRVGGIGYIFFRTKDKTTIWGEGVIGGAICARVGSPAYPVGDKGRECDGKGHG